VLVYAEEIKYMMNVMFAVVMEFLKEIVIVWVIKKIVYTSVEVEPK
jgi:hypothetical protein